MIPALFHQRHLDGRIRFGERSIAIRDFHAIATDQNETGTRRWFAAGIAAYNHLRQ